MAVNTPVRLRIHVQDSLGVRSAAVLHVLADDAQTLAQLKTALGNLLTTIQNTTLGGAAGLDIINGKIIAADAAVVPTLGATTPDGLANVAPYLTMPATPGGFADSRVDEVGVWDMNVTGTPYHYGVVLPSLNDANLTGAKIDPTIVNSHVAAWQGFLVGAILGGHFTNLDNLVLASTYQTFQANRKHRRRERELSLNPNP